MAGTAIGRDAAGAAGLVARGAAEPAAECPAAGAGLPTFDLGPAAGEAAAGIRPLEGELGWATTAAVGVRSAAVRAVAAGLAGGVAAVRGAAGGTRRVELPEEVTAVCSAPPPAAGMRREAAAASAFLTVDLAAGGAAGGVAVVVTLAAPPAPPGGFQRVCSRCNSCCSSRQSWKRSAGDFFIIRSQSCAISGGQSGRSVRSEVGSAD